MICHMADIPGPAAGLDLVERWSVRDAPGFSFKDYRQTT